MKLAARHAAGRLGPAWRVALPLLLSLLFFLLFSFPPLARQAAAQIPYLDRIPWPDLMASFPTDSTTASGAAAPINTVMIGLDRFWDTDTRWSTNRLALTGLVAAGKSGQFILRTSYVSFDTAELKMLDRWPDLRGEDAEAGWPGESRVVGLGRPELGAVGRFRLPALGHWWYGLLVGLPIGRDQLYPMSAASIPIQVDLRKPFQLGAYFNLALTAGPIWHLDSSREFLDPAAFLDGGHFSIAFQWRQNRRRSLTIGFDLSSFERRTSRKLGLRYWVPIASYDAFGLSFDWEMAGTEHRASQFFLGIVWRFNQRPESQATGTEPDEGTG